jgi:uncharacterized ubiquitin-like protein YukD
MSGKRAKQQDKYALFLYQFLEIKFKNKTMQTLLVTIVGFESSFDLQIPAEVPIGKLIPMLLEICDFKHTLISQRGRAQWTLSIAHSNTTLPAIASLLDAGVVDGNILLLQDTSSLVRLRQTPEPQQTFRPVNIEPGEQTGNIGVRWNTR